MVFDGVAVVLDVDETGGCKVGKRPVIKIPSLVMRKIHINTYLSFI